MTPDERRARVGAINARQAEHAYLVPEQIRQVLGIDTDDEDEGDAYSAAGAERDALEHRLMQHGVSRDDLAVLTDDCGSDNPEREIAIYRRAVVQILKLLRKSRQNGSTARTVTPTGYVPPQRRRSHATQAQ
jgi:hypothetical protein